MKKYAFFLPHGISELSFLPEVTAPPFPICICPDLAKVSLYYNAFLDIQLASHKANWFLLYATFLSYIYIFYAFKSLL